MGYLSNQSKDNPRWLRADLEKDLGLTRTPFKFSNTAPNHVVYSTEEPGVYLTNAFDLKGLRVWNLVKDDRRAMISWEGIAFNTWEVRNFISIFADDEKYYGRQGGKIDKNQRLITKGTSENEID